MPKWTDKTAEAHTRSPELKTTGATQFWAETTTGPLCIISFWQEGPTAAMTFFIDDCEISTIYEVKSLDEAFIIAEAVLLEAGYDVPRDNINVQWSH